MKSTKTSSHASVKQEVEAKSLDDFEQIFISTDPVLSPKQEDDPIKVSPTITVKFEPDSDPCERDSAIRENKEVENIYTIDHGSLFETANTFLFPKQEGSPLAISPGVSTKLELVLEEEEEVDSDPLKLDSTAEKNEGFQARALDNNVPLEALPSTAKKRYQCEICQKSFPSPSGLNIHQRTHTGEKPYKCDICNKRFKQAGNLYMHQRTHTGNKPYECLICMKRCASSSDLSRHTRIHTGHKPYTCLVCNKNFALASSLKKHHRTHTGDKPYMCVICEKKFSDCSALSKHRRTHT
ncbi:zinc finger protein 329-like isoform X1 [Artemia franciscana]|uniref:zinc finger protein 329-like isoform X1 n=1 Tax=Artemia franciscana TaxID=6661 RepID=UPI0032DBEC2A